MSVIHFPYTDSLGWTWINHSMASVGDKTGTCFVCLRHTQYIDIDYHAFFCGSDECNKKIEDDLRRSEEQNPSDFDQFSSL